MLIIKIILLICLICLIGAIFERILEDVGEYLSHDKSNNLEG